MKPILRKLLLTASFIFAASTGEAQESLYPTMQIFSRTGAGYDYVPGVVYWNGLYRMYWCGSRSNYPGDYIFYADSYSPIGPFKGKGSTIANSFSIALAPARTAGTFDKDHACDPSVILFKGKWYLYYGGISEEAGYHRTEIGVAISNDGYTFTRLNGGKSILQSHKETTSLNHYGTGQPSAWTIGDHIYLLYTDTYGTGRNKYSNAGQFVLRSTDPTFQTGVEARQLDTWVKLEDLLNGRQEPYERYQQRTNWALLHTFSNDWGPIVGTSKLLILNHGQYSKLEMIVLDSVTFNILNSGLLSYSLPWTDGPALTRTAEGYAIVNACMMDNYGSFGGTDVFTSKLGIQGTRWTGLCQ